MPGTDGRDGSDDASTHDDICAHPATLTLQPKPIGCRVLHLPIGRPTATAVARKWRPGDVAHCRLCTRCTAEGDDCLVGINRVVREAEARMLSDRDCDWYAMPPVPVPVRARTS